MNRCEDLLKVRDAAGLIEQVGRTRQGRILRQWRTPQAFRATAERLARFGSITDLYRLDTAADAIADAVAASWEVITDEFPDERVPNNIFLGRLYCATPRAPKELIARTELVVEDARRAICEALGAEVVVLTACATGLIVVEDESWAVTRAMREILKGWGFEK